MSDVSQGPGWWLASDNKWYPPELHPGSVASGTFADGEPPDGSTSLPPCRPENHTPLSGTGENPGSIVGRGTKRRSPIRTLLVVAAAGLAILTIVIVVLASERTTALTLQGPPRSSSPRAVAISLSLTRGEFPAGWKSNGEAGLCIAGSQGGIPGTPYCGNPPIPGTAQFDVTYARCLGVPVSHVSMLTGSDELGEPFTYSSSTFTAPTSAAPDTAASDEAPQAQSYFTLEPSTSSEATDLAAFAKPSFLACTKAWWKTNPVLALTQGIVSAVGSKLSLTPQIIRRPSIPLVSGVRVVAYKTTVLFNVSTIHESIDSETVIMGAGRVETVLNLAGTAVRPFPRSFGSALIEKEERLIAKIATS